MELRRALLLFAIVLGIAALVSAVTQPAERKRESTAEQSPAPVLTAPETAPTASPRPDPGVATITIGPKDKSAKLEAGRATTLAVAVEEPGQVELEGLGLAAAAEPSTPARFDLLLSSPGKHRVLFAPARGGELRSIGSIDAVSTE